MNSTWWEDVPSEQSEVDAARLLAEAANETLTDMMQRSDEVEALAAEAQDAAAEVYGVYSVEQFVWSTAAERRQAALDTLRQQQQSIGSNRAVREIGRLSFAAESARGAYQLLQDAIVRRGLGAGSNEEVEQAQQRYNAAMSALQDVTASLATPLESLGASLAAVRSTINESIAASDREIEALNNTKETLDACGAKAARLHSVLQQGGALAQAVTAAAKWKLAAEQQLRDTERALASANQAIGRPQSNLQIADEAEGLPSSSSCNCDAERKALAAAEAALAAAEAKRAAAEKAWQVAGDALDAAVKRADAAKDALDKAKRALDAAASAMEFALARLAHAMQQRAVAAVALGAALAALQLALSTGDPLLISIAMLAYEAAQAALGSAEKACQDAIERLLAADKEHDVAKAEYENAKKKFDEAFEEARLARKRLIEAFEAFLEAGKAVTDAEAARSAAEDALCDCVANCPDDS